MADNRLHDATGHYFHGFHKFGTRGMTRSCDDLLGLHKLSRIERKGFGKTANCDRSASNGKAVDGSFRFAMSNPRGPPLSAVFTVWLSMMPAVGLSLRPCLSRIWATKASLIKRHNPDPRHL